MDRLLSVLWLVKRTADLSIKKKSRPLSPLLLAALKALQNSPQEWISGALLATREEHLLENSQETKLALLLKENQSRLIDDCVGASTTAIAFGGIREQVPSLAPLSC